jgi:hypothetical protein
MSSLHGTEPRKAVNWAEKVPLGQSREWVLARGSNARNPVLLILVGGPGGTETGWFRRYNAALEEHFHRGPLGTTRSRKVFPFACHRWSADDSTARGSQA